MARLRIRSLCDDSWAGPMTSLAVEELLLQIPLLLLPVPVLVPRTLPLYHDTFAPAVEGAREKGKTHRSSAGRDCFRLE